MLCHCDTLPILFCHFNLDGAGKEKNGHRKFRKITKPASYLSYLSGSFGENRGVFPIGKIHEIKEESLRFLGFFS